MRQLATAIALVSGISCLADVGLVSQNAEKTWALYATQDAQVALAQCLPPVGSPDRNCKTAKPALKVARTRFLTALQTRLQLTAALRIQNEIDYLGTQLTRLNAKLQDSTLPPSAKQALASTKQLVEIKLADAKKNQTGPAAEIAFYRKVVASLEPGANWVIDAVESPSDYGMKLPTHETSLVDFLQYTFATDPAAAAEQKHLELSTDSTFDHAGAVAIDPNGGFAVTGSSNEFSHADRYFKSQVTFYGPDGQIKWEDLTNEFAQSWGNHVLVSTGPQTFAVIGSDGDKHAEVRFVNGNDGAPSANVVRYDEYSAFRSLVKTAAGNLLVAAEKADGALTVALLGGKDGAVLNKIPVFADLAKAELKGALETSTGDVVVYGTHGDCLALASLTAKFDNVKWQREACPKGGWSWMPETAVATAQGEFAIGGRQMRRIDEKERENEWDIERHRAVLVGYNANGYPTFRHVTEEVRHWGWEGYNALAYNAKRDEIVAVGQFPYTGVADIFDRHGNFLVHGYANDRFNTGFDGVSVLADGSGYLLAGTVGDNSPYGASYHAAFAVLKR